MVTALVYMALPNLSIVAIICHYQITVYNNMNNAPKEFTEFTITEKHQSPTEDWMEISEHAGLFTGYPTRRFLYDEEWPGDIRYSPVETKQGKFHWGVMRVPVDQTETTESNLTLCVPSILIGGQRKVLKTEIVLSGHTTKEETQEDEETTIKRMIEELRPIFTASMRDNKPPLVAFRTFPPTRWDIVAKGTAYTAKSESLQKIIKQATKRIADTLPQTDAVKKTDTAIGAIANAEIVRARQIALMRAKLQLTF